MAIVLRRDFNERRWAFLRRRRARRTGAQAFVQGGDALRDWLVAVARDHDEEAVDLFVEKVIRVRMNVAVVLWASEALGLKAFEVVSVGGRQIGRRQAEPLAGRPPHPLSRDRTRCPLCPGSTRGTTRLLGHRQAVVCTGACAERDQSCAIGLKCGQALFIRRDRCRTRTSRCSRLFDDLAFGQMCLEEQGRGPTPE